MLRGCGNMRFIRKSFRYSQFPILLLIATAGIILPWSSWTSSETLRQTAAVTPVQVSKPFKNWGLFNTKSQSHIHAPEAWRLTEGSKDILVAVIDTGVDSAHPDLSANIWKGKLGKNEYGWDFVANKPNPADIHGHGTHVAGIIGAKANSEQGVSGVARRVSILPLRYYSDGNSGSTNLRNTIQAIQYAVDSGARIINYSGGGPEFSEAEYLAIKKAEAKGILFVAAAGNDHHDADVEENYYYPSAYSLPNIISVAAIDINNGLLKTSNWGKKKIDVAAPGENIFSTLPGGHYGYMTGTSQATAFVSGLAALLLSKDPTLTPVELKRIIVNSVDPIPALAGKIATGGKINAYQALLSLDLLRKGPLLGTKEELAHSQAEPLFFESPTTVLRKVSDSSTP